MVFAYIISLEGTGGDVGEQFLCSSITRNQYISFLFANIANVHICGSPPLDYF